jgi:hypothetical protein
MLSTNKVVFVNFYIPQDAEIAAEEEEKKVNPPFQ